MATNFWEMADMGGHKQNDRPIWAVGTDKDARHEWLNVEYESLLKANSARFRNIERNFALYKGIQYTSQDTRSDVRDTSTDRAKAVSKITINHLYDLTQNKVSRLVKYRPAVAILPTNDEFEDKIGAEVTEKALLNLWYNENFEGEVQPWFVKLSRIAGECYLFIEWDEDKGEKHPLYKKHEDKYIPELEQLGKTQLLDENGDPETDDDGNPIYLTDQVHVGDVCYSVELPFNVLVQEAKTFKDAKYLFKLEPMNIFEARMKYPKGTDAIEAEEFNIYDYTTFSSRKSNNEVMIRHFYYKKSKELPEGLYIISTSKGIVSMGPLPYKHGELPCRRLTDIDLPGEMHGVSFFDNIKALTGSYNNLTNMAIKQVIMGAHPKWVFPAGTIKKESLGNDFTLVEFKGAIAPQLIRNEPLSASIMTLRTDLKEEFQTIAGVYGVSRGEPPAGVTAAVAIQFLSEQENERANEDVLKYNDWIRQVAIMSIQLMAQFYKEDDGRTLKILGKNNEWKVEFFNVGELEKGYDVRVQNSSALPQSKSARLQTLFELNDRYPEQVKPEVVLDLIDFAQNQKYVDIATVSVKAAEAENEMVLQGKDVAAPEQWEDSLIHWEIHAKAIRAWSFKNKTPVQIQDELKDHQAAHEMFLLDKMPSDPLLAEKLSMLKGFPMFFQMPNAAPPAPTPPVAPMQPSQFSPELQMPEQEAVNPIPEGVPNDMPPLSEQIPGQSVTDPELDNFEPSGAI